MRKTNWYSAYNDVIDSMRNKPFVWGENDCAVGLVSNVLSAIATENPAEEFTGKYKTAAGGLKLMKKQGYDNLADFVSSYLPEIHISETTIGDIAAIPTDDKFGFVLGVVNGEKIIVMTERGVGVVDLLDATRAFKV